MTSNRALADSGTTYVTPDSLGSTRMVTNSYGAVLRCYDYMPFGEEVPTGVGPRGGCYSSGVYPSSAVDALSEKFTGKERDAESGLDYFGARYLSSAQGRWTSADSPLVDQDPSDPQSWNLYGYVRNRPLSFVDLDGQKCADGIDDQSGDTCFTAEATAKAPGLFSRIFGTIGSFFAGFGKEAAGNTLIGTTNTIDLMRQKVYGGPDLRQPLLQPSNNAQFVGSMYGMVFPLMIPGAGEAEIGANAAAEAGGASTALSPFMSGRLLASDLQVQEILSGSGTPIIGAGTGKALDDASRLAATYGGAPGDWAKVASSNYIPAGAKGGFEQAGFSGSFEVHAYQNAKTGQIVELKTKFQ